MTVQDTQYDLHRVEQDESKGRQNDAAQDDRREQARAPDHGQEKHGKPQKPESDTSEKNDDPVVNKSRRRILTRIGLVVLLGAGVLIGYGAYKRQQRNAAAQAELNERENRAPHVRTEKVKAVTDPREIHLPATAQPFETTTIYARQSGYIAKRLVDIGSRVKTGDLLAVISAPEVDDQLTQARAQLLQMQASLEQTEANRTLANVTNNRFTPLVQQGWETKQTGDQNRLNLAALTAAVDVAKANIESQKAQIARLERLQSYERVVAAFNGVVTQRNIDTGSLVTADLISGTPLFALARDDVLRVQVHAPQDAALQLKPGIEATLDVPELPGRSFKGKIARTASALDQASRTLLVEADIANPDGTLTSGLYGTVHFFVPRPEPIIMIPSTAVIFDQHGLQVAIFADGKAHLKKIQIAEDDGAQVQVATGLKADQDLIVNPPAGLTDGAKVTPIPPKKPNEQPQNQPKS